jgi:hypothetical protein
MPRQVVAVGVGGGYALPGRGAVRSEAVPGQAAGLRGSNRGELCLL